MGHKGHFEVGVAFIATGSFVAMITRHCSTSNMTALSMS